MQLPIDVRTQQKTGRKKVAGSCRVPAEVRSWTFQEHEK